MDEPNYTAFMGIPVFTEEMYFKLQQSKQELDKFIENQKETPKDLEWTFLMQQGYLLFGNIFW